MHLKRPPEPPASPAGKKNLAQGALPRSGSFYWRRLPMDTQTVIATCEVLLVVIGIIGLVLVRRE